MSQRFIFFCTSLLLAIHLNAQESRPNILWISCEDISPAWGCYGDQQATTPNIDALAKKSFIFSEAFSNAPICAPARSTLITGIYATSLGTQNLRSEIPIPQGLKILPELLKPAGYFTSNNAKTDYNFSPEGRWDALGNQAHWRNRKDNQPFFSVFNFGITHEGHANSDREEDTKSLSVKHDPDQMVLPPYYPDTEEFRSIMAHQYDLISVFDQEVGKLLDQLEVDGLMDETIIFIFSDHGYGLPRYKRWLYDSGLRVPFILYVPEKYQSLTPNLNGSVVDNLVGFVDFAPTVLHLTGVEVPDQMEGRSFVGVTTANDYIFGYRDRADDVYDMSRSIYDGRYIFIRHFMPQNPYIRDAIIFNHDKRSFEELHRLKDQDKLSKESLKMFSRKPVEELYDLKSDPFELNNLIDKPASKEIASELRQSLHNHMRDTYDTGLMNEGDMMERSGNSSAFEMAHNSKLFNREASLATAELTGKLDSPQQVITALEDSDAAVRYWALVALDAYEGDLTKVKPELITATDDPSIANRVLAAEILIKRFSEVQFLDVYKKCLNTESEPMLLQVAISLRNIGEAAKPLIPMITESVYPKIEGEIWGKYKSWSYPMFIGMALDQMLTNCQQ